MNSETLKNKLKPIVYPIINFIPRRRLKNKNFTIICDNCWAGKVYQELGLPYQTPFVGMFVFSPDYIKMLKNLKYYLGGNIPLTFVKESKYIKDFDNAYPLALLDDIELHFLHYADEEEATQKWNRRLERIHWDNLYFKFNDNDACTYEFIFEEELKGYDYWGFCDTDVLLGDIYQFLEEHSFFENDYARYGLLGHLQIFKNSQEVNHVFMSGQGLNYRLDYHNVFTSEQNFIFDEAEGIQKLFEKSGFEQLQDKFFDDIDISHFSFREYGEDEPKRYYSWSQKHGLKSINLIDGKIVIKHPLYTHFQKRTIECPEFELVESFYVIPNKLVFGEELSIQEIEEVTKNKFYWEYVKSTFFKKFKMEKWSLEFIRHKLRMKK